MKRKILRKDPIQEAVCEFVFDAKGWDWVVPGLVYKRIQNDFPERQEARNLHVSVNANIESTTSDAHHSLERMRFWDIARQKVVQIGENRLSIHYIDSYEGWPKFKELIEHVLVNYEQEAPEGRIAGMSLRYINQMRLPPKTYRIDHLLKTVPQVPNSDDQIWISWFQQVEILREDLNAIIGIRAGSPSKRVPDPENPNWAHIKASEHQKLDLVFAHAAPEYINRERVSDWLESAHRELETIFFDSIHDDYLKEFEPEEIE